MYNYNKIARKVDKSNKFSGGGVLANPVKYSMDTPFCKDIWLGDSGFL